MKNLLLLINIVLLLAAASVVTAQTAGPCAETDKVCKINVLLKAIQDDPKEPENYYNLALAYSKNGNYKQAVELYSMYVAIPGIKTEYLADGYNNRALMRRKLDQNELAVEDYSKAISLAPANASFAVNRGNAYSDLKKYDAALADYAVSIKLKPDYAPAYSGRAYVYGVLGRTAEALQDFNSAIAYAPTNPEHFYNRGVIYGKRAEYAKAIADYDKYIEMLPDEPAYLADGYLNRGIAHFSLGNKEQAIKDITKFILLDPQNPKGYRVRAKIYRAANNIALATADEKKEAELSGTK